MTMDLSLIVPCYNEAGHLEASVRTVIEVLELTPWAWEIVFVDDGSTDDTRAIIARLAAGDPRCRFIFHEQNRGRGAAFKTGFAASRGVVTGFVDIDLEVHARYIPSLVAEIEKHGADIATGNRHYLLRQTGGLHRAALSWAYRRMCDVLLGLDFEDSETGCKFFKRSTTAAMVLGSESDGWFWDTEVIARARLANAQISEVPVLFLRRADKASTVRVWRDSWDYLRALHGFRGTMGLSRRTKSPIYWSGHGYDTVMRVLYGRQYRDTYAAVADLIPGGAHVVDVCCGTARLYQDFLRERGCRYLGLDLNGDFVIHARRRGVDVRWFNLLTDPVPAADYVVMTSSLWHFGQRVDEILDKMRRAARCAVIISEVVRDWTEQPAITRTLAALASAGGVGDQEQHFTTATFAALARRHGAEVIHDPGKRNAIAVFPALVT